MTTDAAEAHVMVRKLAVFLLVVALLPACASMFLAFPPEPAGPAVAQGEAALFQQAEASYRQQAYRQAYRQYDLYVSRFPQGPRVMEARLRAAEILGLLNDWRGSLQYEQQTLRLQPAPEVSQKARYGIGRAYFKLGEYQQASQVLNNLTAEDLPRSLWFSTQALLAEIALKQGRIPQAFSRLRLAGQDLSVGDPEWFRDLKTRFLEKATTPDLEQLASLYPDNPLTAALLLQLARRAQANGDHSGAYKWASALKSRFPDSPEAADADRLLAAGKVRLGCLLPLSGQLSSIGFRVQRGMELAAKGLPVELAYRDTQSDPAVATSLTRDLAQDQNVLAILGPLSSSVAQSAADAAQAASIPLIALSQKDGLTQTGPWIFQAFMTPRQQVQALVRYALGRGIKHFLILYPDSSYGRTFFRNYQEELAAQGGELTAQAFYSPGSQEFAPTLGALVAGLQTQPGTAAAPTALFIPDDAETVATIAAGLASTPLKQVQLLGTNLLHNPRITEAQIKALQGIIFPDAFFAGDPNPEVQKFIQAYRQQYGGAPDYLVAQGFLVVKLMAQVVKTHHALTRMALPQQLLTLKDVPQLPWFLGFNSQRQEDAALYLLTLTGSGIQMVSPATAVEAPAAASPAAPPAAPAPSSGPALSPGREPRP
jgi:branched-chain amino acid transport system substrate-binding protein